MSLGIKLKQIRKYRKKNQKEVAEYLGFGVSTYSQYENDLRNPDYNTLRKLRDFFEVPYYYLLDDYDQVVEDDYDHEFFAIEYTLSQFQDVFKRARKLMTKLDSLIGEQNEPGEFEYFKSALKGVFIEYESLVFEMKDVYDITELHDKFLEYLK